jgi:hypothetical protein
MTHEQIEAFIEAYGNIKMEFGFDTDGSYLIHMTDPTRQEPIYGGGVSMGAALEAAFIKLKERVELWPAEYEKYYDELEG